MGWLLGLGAVNRNYRYVRTVFATFFEFYYAVGQGEQGMVLANAHVSARMVSGTPLTNDDITGNDGLATINLHTQSLAMRFATVVRTTCSFFVCHFLMKLKR
jgi:hypothetical protein